MTVKTDHSFSIQPRNNNAALAQGGPPSTSGQQFRDMLQPEHVVSDQIPLISGSGGSGMLNARLPGGSQSDTLLMPTPATTPAQAPHPGMSAFPYGQPGQTVQPRQATSNQQQQAIPFNLALIVPATPVPAAPAASKVLPFLNAPTSIPPRPGPPPTEGSNIDIFLDSIAPPFREPMNTEQRASFKAAFIELVPEVTQLSGPAKGYISSAFDKAVGQTSDQIGALLLIKEKIDNYSEGPINGLVTKAHGAVTGYDPADVKQELTAFSGDINKLIVASSELSYVAEKILASNNTLSQEQVTLLKAFEKAPLSSGLINPGNLDELAKLAGEINQKYEKFGFSDEFEEFRQIVNADMLKTAFSGQPTSVGGATGSLTQALGNGGVFPVQQPSVEDGARVSNPSPPETGPRNTPNPFADLEELVKEYNKRVMNPHANPATVLEGILGMANTESEKSFLLAILRGGKMPTSLSPSATSGSGASEQPAVGNQASSQAQSDEGIGWNAYGDLGDVPRNRIKEHLAQQSAYSGGTKDPWFPALNEAYTNEELQAAVNGDVDLQYRIMETLRLAGLLNPRPSPNADRSQP